MTAQDVVANLRSNPGLIVVLVLNVLEIVAGFVFLEHMLSNIGDRDERLTSLLSSCLKAQ